jgi:Ca2+-binding EF-hand superfamily protein
MASLKIGFVKKDKDNTGKMKLNEFKAILNTILKNMKEEKDTLDLIINFSKSESEEDIIQFDKLNSLVEVYQFYPLIIKKDKNHSSSIYQILNSNKPADDKTVSKRV